MYPFISICVYIFSFEVFKICFKWGMTVLNLQIKVKCRKGKTRSKMGLLNTLKVIEPDAEVIDAPEAIEAAERSDSPFVLFNLFQG